MQEYTPSCSPPLCSMDFRHEIPYSSLQSPPSAAMAPLSVMSLSPCQLGQRSHREWERLDRDQRQQVLLCHPSATALTLLPLSCRRGKTYMCPSVSSMLYDGAPTG